MPRDSGHATTWAARLIASLPPGGAALTVAPPGSAHTRALRDRAACEGWSWVGPGERAPAPGARSVVIAGRDMTPDALAGEVLACTRRGVRAVLVVGRPVGRTPWPRERPTLVREACARYGAGIGPEATFRAALSGWRAGDTVGARRAIAGLTTTDLLSDGIAVAHDLVLLDSILACESGALFDAEAFARAALLAAAIAPGGADAFAKARLALGRVLLEQGHLIPASGALDGLHADDPAVRVIAHVLHVRLALACGAPAVAGRHVASLAGLASNDGWATGHLWDARARLRAAVHDRHGAREACARGEALAARQGCQRRVAKFAAQRIALASVGGTRNGRIEDRRRWIVVDDLVAVLETCQEQADEVTAIARVGARVMARLGACGVAVVATGEGGPGPVLGACGVITSMPPWLDDVLVAGLRRPIDPEHPAGCGAPIRTGGRIIGALLCEWAPGALVPPAETAALVDTAAMALAPVVRSLVERRIETDAGDALLKDLVGGSQAMQGVRRAVMRAAGSPFPVLVEGESGSGKELVARAVHRLSPRRSRRFVALNCAAMTDELVEAELFGHARGAFTGAVGERPGLFEEASEGTLFLDEVAELSPRAQAKLLRVLQEGEVRRVGENRARRVDVRVVAASNRALASEAQAARFRADLLYRLDVIRITVPPLRARLDDLPLLAVHLWRDVSARAGCRAALGTAVLDMFGRYDWPGNVRELQNVLATLAVAAPKRGIVPVAALPAHVIAWAAPGQGPLPLDRARREFDARYVAAALRRAGGRPSVAARELGLTRQGLAKLMVRLRLPARASTDRTGAM